jgi:DNA helicase II / ATP-dependent DNA helicase PcrA
VAQDYLNELNAAQREAVVNFKGPSLVIAGAGSGKTRVLTYRIAHLLEQGVRPHRILALTFTNKAASEMKERIGQMVGNELARSLWMGTFHSIFAKILRVEAANLGFTSNFTIYDTADSKSLVRAIIKELQLDTDTYKDNDVYSRISSAKNNLVTAQTYANQPQLVERDKASKKPRVSDIYKIYVQRCKKADAMDFDDLLLYTNILFRDFPDVLEKYQQHFDYILVDEYQDTNFSQYLIINKLSLRHHNICVVGDDAQSIYSFRGAKIENILNFRNDYPNYQLFKLEQNYRSTQTIVDAANSVIAKNKKQIQKKVWSSNDQGEKIKVFSTGNDIEEGFVVSNEILDMHLRDQQHWQDFAILYRTNAQSRIFEEALRKRNVPYKLYGGISFYQRKEIKDVLSYYRLIINHRDEEALKRIINYPVRGIGDTTVGKIEACSNEKNISMWQVLCNLDAFNLDVNRGTAAKLTAFASFIQSFSDKLKTTDAYDLAFEVATASGILKELHNEKTPEAVSKYENLQELLNAIKEFSMSVPDEAGLVTLDRYLENVALLTDVDNEKAEDRDKVTLMTIHSAKGLEFNNIFIVGLEEDLFPSRIAATSDQEVEEERRLFYVALTRARQKAMLSYSSMRFKWGTPNSCKPSRFLREIDSQYIDFSLTNFTEEVSPVNDDDFAFARKQYQSPANIIPKKSVTSTPVAPQRLVKITAASGKNQQSGATFEASDASAIQAGMMVEHERFGTGKVLNVEGQATDLKATVFFQNAGQKQLLLKFAKLRIIG